MPKEYKYDGVLVDARSSFDALPIEIEVRSGGKPLVLGLFLAALVGLLAWTINDVVPAGVFGDAGAMAE
ncbi:hypothetical protein [Halomonas denitrificans]|nr:hypothetical protein [Halomonas denitrificans]